MKLILEPLTLRPMCCSRLRWNEKCLVDQLLLGQKRLENIFNSKTFLYWWPLVIRVSVVLCWVQRSDETVKNNANLDCVCNKHTFDTDPSLWQKTGNRVELMTKPGSPASKRTWLRPTTQGGGSQLPPWNTLSASQTRARNWLAGSTIWLTSARATRNHRSH